VQAALPVHHQVAHLDVFLVRQKEEGVRKGSALPLLCPTRLLFSACAVTMGK
jgi:hypothetical protein